MKSNLPIFPFHATVAVAAAWWRPRGCRSAAAIWWGSGA